MDSTGIQAVTDLYENSYYLLEEGGKERKGM